MDWHGVHALRGASRAAGLVPQAAAARSATALITGNVALQAFGNMELYYNTNAQASLRTTEERKRVIKQAAPSSCRSSPRRRPPPSGAPPPLRRAQPPPRSMRPAARPPCQLRPPAASSCQRQRRHQTPRAGHSLRPAAASSCRGRRRHTTTTRTTTKTTSRRATRTRRSAAWKKWWRYGAGRGWGLGISFSTRNHRRRPGVSLKKLSR